MRTFGRHEEVRPDLGDENQADEKARQVAREGDVRHDNLTRVQQLSTLLIRKLMHTVSLHPSSKGFSPTAARGE